MQMISNMKIGVRLTLGFLVVVALTAIIGLIGLRNLEQVNGLSDRMYELDVAGQWRAFIETHQLDAVVCIAAALRRGVLDEAEANRYQRPAVNLPKPWELSGLGQLHEAAQVADRLVCFGGD